MLAQLNGKASQTNTSFHHTQRIKTQGQAHIRGILQMAVPTEIQPLITLFNRSVMSVSCLPGRANSSV